MKKFSVIVIMMVISLHAYTQDIYNLPEMLRFSLQYYMQNPPFAEYGVSVWEPGERIFVSTDFPDSCQVQTIFPKESFPDVRFYRAEEFPVFKKSWAPVRRGHLLKYKKKVPHLLHAIRYKYEEEKYLINIVKYGIIPQETGVIKKTAVSGREYVFTLDSDSVKWVLEGYTDYGP
ncbi:MAG: hypothetical protein KBS77_03835 [Bacteroidales bacterium]|nr:hypothetical protein [Candidatus Colicola faecequi]